MPIPTELAFQGQLTEQEFTKAQRITLSPLILWMPRLMLVALVSVILTGGLSAIMDDPADQLPRLLGSTLFAAIVYIAPRVAIRKAWTSSPLMRESFSGALSEDGLAWKGRYSEGHLPWATLYGYRAKADVLLIYTSNRQAHILLRRFFDSEEEWQSALALVMSRLRKR